MLDVNELAITKLLVYGDTTPSDDPNDHIRPDGAQTQPSINIDMLAYLIDGAGRYALPSRAPIIENFFSDFSSGQFSLPNGT